MCRFCLIQRNGKPQDEELSIPWFISTVFAVVLDLKGFMESMYREDEAVFLSEFSFEKTYFASIETLCEELTILNTCIYLLLLELLKILYWY